MLVLLPFVLLKVVLPVMLPVMVAALLLGAAGDLDDDALGHSGAVGMRLSGRRGRRQGDGRACSPVARLEKGERRAGS